MIQTKINKKVEAQENLKGHYEEKLKKYRQKMAKESFLKENSIAFVSFKTQAQAECVFMLETQRMKIRWLFAKFFPCFCQRKGHYIHQAPEPDDVKWKFIGYSAAQRTWSILVSYIGTLFVVGAAFAIQLWLRYITTNKVNQESDDIMVNLSIHALQWASALLVTVVNGLIVKLAFSLSSYEKHLSYSMFTLSHTRKLIFTQFVNSAGVPVALIFLP